MDEIKTNRYRIELGLYHYAIIEGNITSCNVFYNPPEIDLSGNWMPPNEARKKMQVEIIEDNDNG
jgi:hypothetical protein